MNNDVFYNYLRMVFGENASFKQDQLEAIVSTVNNHFTLVVEKTGWGKSMVYFLATKYFRERNFAPTIIISPLKSLMRNQIDSANKLELKARMITGDLYKTSNKQELINLYKELEDNSIDILFITPEQLNNVSRLQSIFKNIKEELALFVVDEVHCISEWGHDFRPDYCAIKDFINSNLVDNKRIHILATTATANNFVIEDLKKQFNCFLNIIRGQLSRESLSIKLVSGLSMPQKYAWILDYLNHIEGSGIIYALTINDCNMLSLFLLINGIKAAPYHSENTGEENKILEDKFYKNELKVLVATTALGMGYDKPDVAFVIHLQSPKSMLEYYQQIGRAGRNLKSADAILMNSNSDEKILDYFINNSFPDAGIMRLLLNFIDKKGPIGLTDILSELNIKRNDVTAMLKHLVSRKLVNKENSKYFRSYKADDLDDYIKEKNYIYKIRCLELEKMHEYFSYNGCYMKFISEQLNDLNAHECGRCDNCIGKKTSNEVNLSYFNKAKEFIEMPYKVSPKLNAITPRKRIALSAGSLNIPDNLMNNIGFFLTRYNYGAGELVAKGKYQDNHFSDHLVVLMARMIRFLEALGPEHDGIVKGDIIAYIPSKRRPNLVKDFAYALSKSLGIECCDILLKQADTKEQKTMQNSVMQAQNVVDSFVIDNREEYKVRGKNVFLVDDMVDSRWTFTICGYMILEIAKANSLTPLALADTSNRQE